MTALTDWQIKERVAQDDMIDPFVAESVRSIDGRKVFSYGLSGSGYDFRLAPEGLLLGNYIHLNPKDMSESSFDKMELHTDSYGEFFWLSPGGCMLGHSIEYVRMPDDVMAICHGKSSHARAFCVTITTPLEAGWDGQITFEIVNPTGSFMRVYANEGIVQAVFLQLGGIPEVTYAKRGGKYQNQTGITIGRV